MSRTTTGIGAAALLLLGACTPPPQTAASACAAPLKPAVQVDLFFGGIAESEWAAFLDGEVTPRFPAGLSVLDVAGQYRGASGAIGRERSKLLVVIVLDPPSHAPKVEAIVETFRRRYRQESVLRVERPVCAGL